MRVQELTAQDGRRGKNSTVFLGVIQEQEILVQADFTRVRVARDRAIDTSGGCQEAQGGGRRGAGGQLYSQKQRETINTTYVEKCWNFLEKRQHPAKRQVWRLDYPTSAHAIFLLRCRGT